ncbi:MAG: CoA pyrophosphatase [Allomuricauda sp.]|nr:MAG: CoA pyrophosphatase [Allomuricauda sp.]
MNFTQFSKQVVKIKNLHLPGEEAHFKMVPSIRERLIKEKKYHEKKPKRAGVMALFYPDADAVTSLLLILRKTYPGVHSNQIGFPGGKHEKEDDSLLQTALRETNEEVGVQQGDIEVLKELTDVYIPPSNFLVTPFLGLYKDPKPFVIQESEVEALVEVKLNDFLEDANLIEQELSTSYAQNIKVPAFKLNNQIVWGATAMMLSEVRLLLKKVL